MQARVIAAATAMIADGQVTTGFLDFAVYATGQGCAAVNISGNAYVDSFDSSRGSYQQTKTLEKGIIGSSGNVTISSGAVINGPVFTLNTNVGDCANVFPESRSQGRLPLREVTSN